MFASHERMNIMVYTQCTDTITHRSPRHNPHYPPLAHYPCIHQEGHHNHSLSSHQQHPLSFPLSRFPPLSFSAIFPPPIEKRGENLLPLFPTSSILHHAPHSQCILLLRMCLCKLVHTGQQKTANKHTQHSSPPCGGDVPETRAEVVCAD